MASDNDSIDLACLGLKNAVKKYCKKRKRDASLARDNVVEHACHILRQLTSKRKSLEQGLTALEECWRVWFQQVEEDTMASVLTHVFHHYLRLADGMNLMSSGECRHQGDVQEARKSKFKSHLNKQSLRGDGYTTLYSAQHYTGYGWDEFFDANVGVLKRFQQHKVKWDTVLDYGAQAFESCLDQHETACQEIQSRFEQLRSDMVKELRRHCSKVEFRTRDKMERLQVTTKEGTLVSLERQGKDFQVHDEKGCLPNGWAVQDWKCAMEYTGPSRKRRRVICDSSSDEEAEADKKLPKPKIAPAVNGLKVQVKNKVVEKKTNLDISLNKVKKKFHVNAKALEASREVLEAEEATGGKVIAASDDMGMVNETDVLKEDVEDARTRVQRMKRVLARLETRDEFDEELWDARECLREASMTLGSNLLSLCAVDNDSDDHGKNLTEARYCFREARDLVKKQETVHQADCKESNDLSAKARSVRRKLLLLRGRAHVNMAIALIELSLLKCPESLRRSLQEEAATELENAQDCARAIRARATIDETIDAIGRLDADRLDALANRWLGKAHWHKRRYKEAALASEKGAMLFIDHKCSTRNEDLQEAGLDLGVECFYASTSLADLALDDLEKLHIVAQGHPKREECLARGQELFTMASDAYKRAALISTGLVRISKSGSLAAESTLKENGILTSDEIENIMKQMNSWWDEKKSGVALRSTEGISRDEPNKLRNDLFSSAGSRPQNHSNSPIKRFTIKESSSRRASRRRNQGRNGLARSTGTRISSQGENSNRNSSSNSHLRYAKWGDAFLPQKKTDSGETVPILPYPCRAPELPPGFFKPYYQPKKQ